MPDISVNNQLLLKQDRYRIEEILGHGGGGTVYRAYDTKLLRDVAIKLIVFDGPDIFKEAQALAQLDSTSIIKVFDVFHDNKFVAIVMELINSRQIISSELIADMKANIFYSFFTQTLDAVKVVHSKGLLHLDLKPGNILVNEQGLVKVTDFGIAISLNTLNKQLSSSLKNEYKGSWTCLSPEQLGQKPLSQATDVFALGILLFTFLYKKHPFIVHGDMNATRNNIINAQIEFPEVDTTTSPKMTQLVIKMLNKDPAHRPKLEYVIQEVGSVYQIVNTSELVNQSEMPTETLVFPKQRSHWKKKIALGFVALTSLSLSAYFIGAITQPISTSLVIPTLKIEQKIQSNQQKYNEHNLLVATIIEDEIESAIIYDPQRRLVSKKDWGGTRNWQKEAELVDVDEIVFSDVSCDNEFCEINISIFDRSKNDIIQSMNKTIPHADLLVLSQVIEQSLVSNLGYSYKKKMNQNISNDDLRDYYTYHKKLENNNIQLSDVPKIQEFSKKQPGFAGAQLDLGLTYLALYSKSKNDSWLEKSQLLTRQLKQQFPNEATILQLDFKNQLAVENIAAAEKILTQLKGLSGIDTNHLVLSELMLLFKKDPQAAYNKLISLDHPRLTYKYFKHKTYMENSLLLFEELEATSREWLIRFPDAYWANFYLASSYMSLGKLNSALTLLNSYPEKNSDAVFIESIGICHLLLGNYQESILIFKTALKITPNSPNTLLNLAEALKAAGDTESENYFLKALEAFKLIKKPSSIEYAYKALIDAHLNRKEDATIGLQKALQSNQSDPSFSLIASYVYSMLGQPEAALFNAKIAMKQGYREHWFNLPWTQTLFKQLTQ